MPKIIFIEHSGATHTVDASSGISVMEAAKMNGVPGIDADCGGSCACATCHVHVSPVWLDKAGKRSEDEQDLLEVVDNSDRFSRLSCQITVSDALDGLVVQIPASQH